MAAAAAGILVSGLAVVTTSTPTQAQPGDRSGDRSGDRAGAPFTVTARVTETEPELGDTIKIRGSVKPVRPGSKVLLQKKYAGDKKWKNVGTAKLNALGKFRFKDEVDSVRFRKYRVVKAADRKRSLGTSDKLGVTVFGWRDLTSLGPVAGSGTHETDSVTINAKSYAQSVVGSTYANSGFLSYNLNRGCKSFSGRLGLGDSSVDTATGLVSLSGDGAELYSNSFGLTQSAAVTEDLTGVFRITFAWTSSNTAGHAGGPVRSHRRDGVTAGALQLLTRDGKGMGEGPWPGRRPGHGPP